MGHHLNNKPLYYFSNLLCYFILISKRTASAPEPCETHRSEYYYIFFKTYISIIISISYNIYFLFTKLVDAIAVSVSITPSPKVP